MTKIGKVKITVQQPAAVVEMTVEEMTPEEYEFWKSQHLEEQNGTEEPSQ